MNRNPRAQRAAFALVDLAIVVAVLAIVAAIAIPRFLRSRVSSNESAAIATLRSLVAAQLEIRSSAEIDSDADGTGEYGYLGELSGSAPLRISAGGKPALGVVGSDELDPAVLSSAFGEVSGSVIERQGYHFQVWLPGAAVAGRIPGIAEASTGGAGVPLPDPNHGELLFCIYAWPAERGETGRRSFFTNQEGHLLQCEEGAEAPGFSEAFSVAGDMGSALRIGTHGGLQGTVWTPVR